MFANHRNDSSIVEIGHRVGTEEADAAANVEENDDDATGPSRRPAKRTRRTTVAGAALSLALLSILALLLVEAANAASTSAEGEESEETWTSTVASRIHGIKSLLESHPSMMFHMVIRVIIAIVTRHR